MNLGVFDGKPTMTVAELIAALQQFPHEAPVITEGCDCVGPAAGVEVEDDGVVIIHRYMDPTDLHKRPR
jgi:hypothetical protein